MNNKEIDLVMAELPRAYLKACASISRQCSYYVHHTPKGEHMQDISLYLRCNAGYTSPWQHPSIVFSSIDIHNSGEGTFTELLRQTKELCIKRRWNLCLECVQNYSLRAFLEREGFAVYDKHVPLSGSSMWWHFDSTLPETTPMFPDLSAVRAS